MSESIELIATRPLEDSNGVLGAIINAAGGVVTSDIACDGISEATHVSVPSHMVKIFTNQAEMNGYNILPKPEVM